MQRSVEVIVVLCLKGEAILGYRLRSYICNGYTGL